MNWEERDVSEAGDLKQKERLRSVMAIVKNSKSNNQNQGKKEECRKWKGEFFLKES